MVMLNVLIMSQECKNLKKMDVGGLSGDTLGLNINVDLMINFRSICEDFLNAKWKKIEEKEDFHKKIHP